MLLDDVVVLSHLHLGQHRWRIVGQLVHRDRHLFSLVLFGIARCVSTVGEHNFGISRFQVLSFQDELWGRFRRDYPYPSALTMRTSGTATPGRGVAVTRSSSCQPQAR